MHDYEKFVMLIRKKTNIDLACYKEKQMKRRLTTLAKRNNFESFEEYYLQMVKDKKLFNEFINYITINVSDFYRNARQWETLEEHIIPRLLSRKPKLKIWSSACSTGEEPYSLVMLLTKFMDLNSIRILATDIDTYAIEKAKTGLYREQSLKDLPRDFIARYFVKEGDFYRISDDIKKRVEFGHLNLLRDEYPSQCDLILCRNVLIYFTEEAKEKVYKKFHDALDSEGILFVGSTEQIILPHRYNFIPVRNFFYQRI